MRASIFVLALGSTIAASAFGGASPAHAQSSIVDRSLLVQVQADGDWRRDGWRRDRYYRPYYYRPVPPPVAYYPPPPVYYAPPPAYYAPPPPRPTFGFWIR